MPDTLVPLRTAGAGMPLYCVHSASGSAYSYVPLIPLLDPGQPVYGLESPGFDDEDEKPLTSVAELADTHLSAIAAHRPDEPIYLLGWSMGGVVAYEMAQRLYAAGTPAPMLITVDTPVPVPRPVPGPRQMLRRFAGDLTGAAPFSEQSGLDSVLAAHAGEEEPVEDTFAALSDAGLIPAELDPETLTQRYAVFRANLIALFGYQPTGGYPGPLIAIRGAESPPEGVMDWSGLSAGATTETVPGDHYTMWEGEGLAAIADIVRSAVRVK